jgi:hypothetical protein
VGDGMVEGVPTVDGVGVLVDGVIDEGVAPVVDGVPVVPLVGGVTGLPLLSVPNAFGGRPPTPGLGVRPMPLDGAI